MMQSRFQGPLLGCFEYVPYTPLTIVCTINVSIDCKKNKVSNPYTRKNILDCKSKQQDAWFVFCIKIKFVCKDDGSLAPPEQDRLEHGPHSCKLPMFAEDVSRVAFAILPME